MDGLNRRPGLSTNCGNPGDTPIDTPAHDYVCKDADEIVVFTADFGAPLPIGTGSQALFASDGSMINVGSTFGGPVPRDGFAIQATGSAARALEKGLKNGVTGGFESVVRSGADTLSLGRGDYVVNGGPTLVASDSIVVDESPAEGWSPERIGDTDRQAFFNGWFARRNPRTAVGTTKDGSLLLVTVDGRRPAHSLGASIPETADLMKTLGATDAINLDGGGSTAMVLGKELVGTTSDATGERSNGDAILLIGR